MKKAALFLFILSISYCAKAQERYRKSMLTLRQPLINIGVKAGFNSSMFFTDALSIDGKELAGIQNNYKIGYFATFFCRFNLKKHHFIQPELSYNVSKGSISINDPLTNSDLMPEEGLIRTTITSFDLPVLYGYKFIDSPPYGMALIVGPKIAWNWKQHTRNEYSGFYQQEIRETYYPLTYSAIAGIAVNISNIFFDFRYEIGLHNITQSISYNQTMTESPYNSSKLMIKRRRNVMSFSLGVIF